MKPDVYLQATPEIPESPPIPVRTPTPPPPPPEREPTPKARKEKKVSNNAEKGRTSPLVKNYAQLRINRDRLTEYDSIIAPYPHYEPENSFVDSKVQQHLPPIIKDRYKEGSNVSSSNSNSTYFSDTQRKSLKQLTLESKVKRSVTYSNLDVRNDFQKYDSESLSKEANQIPSMVNSDTFTVTELAHNQGYERLPPLDWKSRKDAHYNTIFKKRSVNNGPNSVRVKIDFANAGANNIFA